jgi:Zn-dependent M16 (insulinase) family peptidase
MLESQKQEALDLGASLMLNADFDNHLRMEQIMREHWNDLKASLLPGGHSYVMVRANCRFSTAPRLEDKMFGIGQVLFLESLLKHRDRWGELSSLMKDLRARIFSSANLTLTLTMDGEALSKHRQSMTEFWINRLPPSLETSPLTSSLLSDIVPPPREPGIAEPEGLGIAALIGFVGKALRGSALEDKDHASHVLLSQLLKTGPLWEKIRMKGGAYGAFSVLSGLDHVFSFATYRDPEIEKSLEAFRESLEVYLDFQEEEELEKALISVVGKEMKPLCPAEKSMIVLKRFLYNISDEARQRKRDRLMDCRSEDLQRASAALLSRWEDDGITVMAHPDKLKDASKAFPGLFENRIDLPR